MHRIALPVLTLVLGLVLGASSAPRIGQAQPTDPCIPTPTPSITATPTRTATPTPGVYLPMIVIYEDATAVGWQRSGYTVTVSDVTSPVYSGAKAMRLAYGGWGGVRFTPSSPAALSGSLSLALRGAGRMRVIVGSTQIGLLTATDAWVAHTLPLPSGNVTMIELKNDLSSAATVYVDLLRAGQAEAPPTPVITTVTPGPTNTPTPTPLAGGTLRILPLGDSITEGQNGGYRDVLYDRLTAAGYTVDYVGPRYDQYSGAPDKDHAGTPGHNTGNILGVVDGHLATYDPDVVLLMIGTNDLAWWAAEASAPADAAARVGQILDRIAASGARVILATTPPIQDASVPPDGRSRAQLLRDYNAALRTLAAARGVALVDIEATLTLSDLYDGTHPSEAAHDAKIAPLWAAAILGS
jgi:lysophospholipase L1-like esterase